MKSLLLLGSLAFLLSSCTTHQGASTEPVESIRDPIRERGTTGFGVGSDTTTQTGIDAGTRSGSGLP